MKPLPALALFTALTALPHAGVHADEILGADNNRRGGIYLAGFGGLTFAHEIDTDTFAIVDFPGEGTTRLTDFELDLDDALSFGGSFGVALGRLRAEAEVSFTEADAVYRLEDRGGVTLDDDVDVSYLNVMANLIYDQPIVGRLDAYVGGGVGVSIVDVDLGEDQDFVEVDENDDPTGRTFNFDGDPEAVLAAQVLAGLSLRITDGVALTAGYRGVLTNDADLDGFSLDSSFRSSVEAGLRITF